ncbi:MAG: hypothetical protein ACFCUJ_12570 [Thiotrichales bacterium]
MLRKAYAVGAVLLSQLILCGGSLANAGDDLVLDIDASAVGDDMLSESRGREGGVELSLQLSETNQAANLENNQLSFTGVTGANTIADGSFNGFSGIGHIIQNSGNHVIIQDNTTVNVSFTH